MVALIDKKFTLMYPAVDISISYDIISHEKSQLHTVKLFAVNVIELL